MAWLWSSWEEYADYIQPTIVSRGLFRAASRRSWFEIEHHLYEAASEIRTALASLYELGFKGDNHTSPPSAVSVLDEAHGFVIELIRAGEVLLLYHKRLAKNDAAYGFLSQHDILEHWERYSASHRIFDEVDQLVKDTLELLNGYDQFVQIDDQFLVYNLDLPPELEAEFRLARNLFSVGFEDVGVLITGRGLEGVLRRVAGIRKIMLEVKGKLEPASDADLHDLIEVMFRLRWKVKGTRPITPQTRALLHYLRALRNGSAHANTQGQLLTVSPRETASIITETANHLWKEITGTRAMFVQTTIQKTW